MIGSVEGYAWKRLRAACESTAPEHFLTIFAEDLMRLPRLADETETPKHFASMVLDEIR